MQLKLELWSLPNLTYKDTCFCMLSPKPHRWVVQPFPFHVCSFGTLHTGLSVQCCNNSVNCPKCLHIPFLEPFLFFIWPFKAGHRLLRHKWVCRGQLVLTSCSRTSSGDCQGWGFPSLLAPLPHCPMAFNTGTSDWFSNVNSKLPAGDKNLPDWDTETFQWFTSKSVTEGKLRYRSWIPVLF